jgi:hypothetical protein
MKHFGKVSIRTIIFVLLLAAILVSAAQATARPDPLVDRCVGGEVSEPSCSYLVFLPQVGREFTLGWTFAFPCQGLQCPPPPPPVQ